MWLRHQSLRLGLVAAWPDAGTMPLEVVERVQEGAGGVREGFLPIGCRKPGERPPLPAPLFRLQAGSAGPRLQTMNHTLAMFNLGGQEMVIIFLIVLLLFGAKKLPELARGVGKSMGEFKKAREDFEKEITRSEDEVRIKEAAGKEAHDKA